MDEIALIRSGDPVIRIIIARTTIPAQMLPSELSLPAHARIAFCEKSIKIEVQFLDPDSDFWQSDSNEGEYHSFELGKEDLMRVVTGAKWRNGRHRAESCAILEIRDPYEVEDSLQLLFASLDGNNPEYWIKLFAKKLNQRYGIPIVQAGDIEDDDDLPF